MRVLKGECFDWSPERCAELARLVLEEGMSQTAIAMHWKHLPNAPSRSSIGSKVTSLGLRVRDRKPRERKPAEVQSAISNHTGGAQWLSMRRIESSAKPHAPSPRTVEPLIMRVVDLTPSTCRFPIGDPARPDFGFCGRGAEGKGVYCATHHAIAYQPPKKKDEPQVRTA